MDFPEQICTVRDSEISQAEEASARIAELTTVREMLQELPQTLAPEVLIPLSPVGFVMGRLKHTNEILVHLGAEWYVKRTAAQAVGIIDRRLAELQPRTNAPETEDSLPKTKEEALARLQRLAEMEKAEEEKFVVSEIKEKAPTALSPTAQSQEPVAPKRISKFMKERQGL